jgi:outer membrane receptor for ferrienterochelin and colicins
MSVFFIRIALFVATTILQTKRVIRKLQILIKLSLLMVLAVPIYGQQSSPTIHQISGWVTDEKGESIVGATISVSDTDLVALSDVRGYFKIKTATTKPFRLKISHIGYESYQVEVDPESQHLKIKLYPASNQLNQVVISSAKTGIELKRSTVSMDIIKPYLIENKAIVNMEGIMNQLPSVNVVDGQVNIRSGSGWSYGSGSRVMVLVDDMPFLSGDAGQVQWKFLPLENLESIEIIKGASSVLYGSSALNGVINIRTAKPKSKPQSKITLITGAYDNPAREIARWSDKIRMQTGIQAYHNERIYNTDFSAAFNFLSDLGYRFGEDDQRFRFNVNSNHRNQHVAGLRYGLNASYMQQISSSFLLWQNFDSGYISKDYNKTLNQARLLTLDPHLTYQTSMSLHKIRMRYNRTINSVENTVTDLNQSNRFNLYFSEYQYVRTLYRNKGTVSGGMMQSFTESNSVLYAGRHTLLNLAPYVQLDYRIGKLQTSLGYRYEHFSMNGQTNSAGVARAGLNFEITKSTFIRSSFGQGYRFPSIAERHITTAVGLVNIFPNPELQPEQGWTAEVGLRQGIKISKDWYGYLDAAYFEQQYANMIEFTFGLWRDSRTGVPLPEALGFKAMNIGSTKISGGDFVVGGEGKLNEDWSLRFLVGYTYTLPVSLEPEKIFAIDSVGNQFTYRATSSDSSMDILKYRYMHLFKSDVELEWKKITIGVSLRYNDYMRNVDRVFVQELLPGMSVLPGIEDARRLNRTGDWITDIRVAYKITNKLKAQVLVNNLTNHEQMTRPGDLRPPRLFLLQLQYSFQ